MSKGLGYWVSLGIVITHRSLIIVGVIVGRGIVRRQAIRFFYDSNKFLRHIDEFDVNRLAVNDEDATPSCIRIKKSNKNNWTYLADFDATTGTDETDIVASDTDNGINQRLHMVLSITITFTDQRATIY